MTIGNWSRSDKMSLAALLIASLSLVASVSLIIVFCVLWLRSPVDRETDQVSQTQQPDNVTTEDAKKDQPPTTPTPPPDNPTTQDKSDQREPQSQSHQASPAHNSATQNKSDQKQPQSKTKGEYDGACEINGHVYRVG